MNRFLIPILLLLILIFPGCSERDNFTKAFQLIMIDKELSAPLLTDMPAEDLRILRNTVFARHGYPFNSEELQYYFYAPGASPQGYSFKESQDYHDGLLSEIDQSNIALIQGMESGDQVVVDLPTGTKQKQEEPPITIRSEALQGLSASQIYFILNEDVINTEPDLKQKYDTPLKVKYYSETDEYANKLNELKSLKKQLIETRISQDISAAVSLNPYSIGKKGFFMNLPYSGYWNSSNVLLYNSSLQTLNQIYGFYSNDEIFEEISYPSNLSTFQVFIPCSEEVGLEIENNISKVRILLEFDIADGKQIVFNEANSSGITHRYPLIKIKDASYKIFIDDKMVWESLIGKGL